MIPEKQKDVKNTSHGEVKHNEKEYSTQGGET